MKTYRAKHLRVGAVRGGLSRGLVGAWLMRERGGALVDVVGGHHAALVNGASMGGGYHGSSLHLSAALQQYASVGNPAALQITGAMSMACFYRLGVPGETAIVGKDSSTGPRGYMLGVSTWNDSAGGVDGGAGTRGVYFYADGGSAFFVAERRPPTVGDARHVVATFEPGSAARIYIDGALAADAATSATGIPNCAAEVQFGARAYEGFRCFFDGDVEYIYIWNRTLSQGEAAELASDPFGMFRDDRAAYGLVRVVNAPVVSLTQATEAAFVDRPRGRSGCGLKVAMEPGIGNRYLEHDLGVERGLLHTRLMVRGGTVTGGWVTLLRGASGAGAETFTLSLHGSRRVVRLATKRGVEIEAAVGGGLAWRCVEAGLDGVSGESRLWIDGRLAGIGEGGATGLVTRTLRVGGVTKAADAVGEMHLDEWVMGDGYIGPVKVEPTGAHMDDAARWLVIYNSASAESGEWAEWYRQQRGVPHANVLGLEMPLNEGITEAAFEAMRGAVWAYLLDNGLDQQVGGILCGLGVPGRYISGGVWHSVSTHLQAAGAPTTMPPSGFYAGSAEAVRPVCGGGAGMRLVARIDGPTLEEAKAWTLRALAVAAAPLESAAKICLDAYTAESPSTAGAMAAMAAWSSGIDAQRLRMALTLPPEASGGGERQFASIGGESFFWGWKQQAPPASFFGASGVARVACVQLVHEAGALGSLRSRDGGWAMAAFDGGYAAVAGACDATNESARPDVGPFFEALRRGWSVGEAWAVSCPLLRSGFELVGDPLMRVVFPRAGWNIYGPVVSRDEAGLMPLMAARVEAARSVSLAAEAQPAEGQTAVYVLRHVDGAGREEAQGRWLALQRMGGLLCVSPMGPVYPGRAGWRPEWKAGAWRVCAVWPMGAAELGVTAVELWRELQGEAGERVSVAENPRGRWVSWEVEPTATAARFWVRVVARDGGSVETPRSAWVVDDGVAMAPLTLV